MDLGNNFKEYGFTGIIIQQLDSGIHLGYVVIDDDSNYSDLKNYYGQQHAMELNKLACSIYNLFDGILGADANIFNAKDVEEFNGDCLSLLNRLNNIIQE